MQDKNICKFISPAFQDTLSVSCFVLEANKEVMEASRILSEHRVILITQGEGKVILDSEHLQFNSGDLIFAFKNETLSVKGDNCAFMYISFDGMRSDELFKRFDITKNNRHFEGFDGLIPLWSESLSRANEQTVDLASESILLYTFSRLFGITVSNNGIVGKIISITEENFSDPELSLTAIARELAYNPKYITRF